MGNNKPENKPENPSAFPELKYKWDRLESKYTHNPLCVAQYTEGGMTLRDYFAAKALPMFSPSLGNSEVNDQIAKRAYQIADAMLKERIKP